MAGALPDQLVAAARGKKLAVFVGAGLSVGAGLPSWLNLLADMLARAERECGVDGETSQLIADELRADPGSRDLPGAFQVLQDDPRVGRGWIEQWLTAICRDESCRPTESHRLLASMRIPLITTNYDMLLEEGFSGRRPLVKTWQEIGPLFIALASGAPIVLKAHGCVDKPGADGKPGSAILTTSDYQRIGEDEAYRKFLELLFGGHTTLFLGYSLDDPDTRAVIAQMHRLYSPSWLPIYMVTRDPLSDELRHDFGVNEIRVADWAGIPDILRLLAPPRPSAGAAIWDRWPYNWDLSAPLSTLRTELAAGKTSILVHGDEQHPPDILAGAIMLELGRRGYRDLHYVYLEDHCSRADALERAETALDLRTRAGSLDAREDMLCKEVERRGSAGRTAFGFLCERRPREHRRLWEFIARVGGLAEACSFLAIAATAEETVPSWEQPHHIVLEVPDYRWHDLTDAERKRLPDEVQQLLRRMPLRPRVLQDLVVALEGGS